MLIFQLVISVGCLYYYYELQTLADTQAPAIEKAQARIRDMECDAIIKETVLELMKHTITDTEKFAEVYLTIALALGLSTGFGLRYLFVLRQGHAANKTV